MRSWRWGFEGWVGVVFMTGWDGWRAGAFCRYWFMLLGYWLVVYVSWVSDGSFADQVSREASVSSEVYFTSR